MSTRIRDAARRLGHHDIASLWARATQGMDLAGAAGRIPARIRFSDRAALEDLEALLIRGAHADLHRWLVEWVRSHPEGFVD